MRISTTYTGLAVIAFLGLLAFTLQEYTTVERGMVIHRLHTETARLASMLFFDKMTALAQITIGVLGGAWAFLTLADTQVKIKSCPTVMCLILTNLALFFSLAIYWYGHDFIVERVFHHATFDIDAPLIRVVKNYQLIWFATGCGYLALTIYFGRKES